MPQAPPGCPRCPQSPQLSPPSLTTPMRAAGEFCWTRRTKTPSSVWSMVMPWEPLPCQLGRRISRVSSSRSICTRTRSAGQGRGWTQGQGTDTAAGGGHRAGHGVRGWAWGWTQDLEVDGGSEGGHGGWGSRGGGGCRVWGQGRTGRWVWGQGRGWTQGLGSEEGPDTGVKGRGWTVSLGSRGGVDAGSGGRGVARHGVWDPERGQEEPDRPH